MQFHFIPYSPAYSVPLFFKRQCDGLVASSLCTTAHPLYTTSANILGAFASEAAVRPDPRPAGGRRRGAHDERQPALERCTGHHRRRLLAAVDVRIQDKLVGRHLYARNYVVSVGNSVR